MLGYSLVPSRELDDLRHRVGVVDEIERTAAYLDIIKGLTTALAEAAGRTACQCAGRPTPPTPPTPAAPALSPAVRIACRQYSAGDKREEVANLRVAERLAALGKQDVEIIAAIQRGAGGPARPDALALAADPTDDDGTGEHTFRVRRGGDAEMAVVA